MLRISSMLLCIVYHQSVVVSLVSSLHNLYNLIRKLCRFSHLNVLSVFAWIENLSTFLSPYHDTLSPYLRSCYPKPITICRTKLTQKTKEQNNRTTHSK